MLWPTALHGHFFGGDSFLVLYTYVPKGKRAEEQVLYVWQGRETTADEKGAAGLLAAGLCDGCAEEHGGRPTVVRVEQGREPDHMAMLFRGKMVVHKGECARTRVSLWLQ